jgi:hypothetical protein
LCASVLVGLLPVAATPQASRPMTIDDPLDLVQV